MSRHLIVGAGAVGRHTAATLVEQGHDVVLASRSGSGPDVTGVRRVAVDASDAGALTALARTGRADVVYNALNPEYHRWEQLWPPLSAALLAAADGRRLVAMANLYVFDDRTRVMAENTPMRPNGHKGEVRRRMTEQALAADADGRLQYAEARASDFFGPGTDRTSYLTLLVLPKASRGRTVWLIAGDPDAPHSWTYLPDVGATLAALGTRAGVTGRVWNVPTDDARTVRQVAADVAALSGERAPAIRVAPWPVVRAAGLAVPFLRELGETRHQFLDRFELDSRTTRRELGLTPTPWDQALRASLAALAV